MENISMDPCEAQLYAVYKSFADSSGNLDLISLTELCNALQMEKSSTEELVAKSRRSGQRITFSRFKDSLVKVLGGASDNSLHIGTTSHSDEESGCEQSPKFIYGAKKYGRRSKPREITGKVKNHSVNDLIVSNIPPDISSKSESSQFCSVNLSNIRAPDDNTETSRTEQGDKVELELDHNKKINCDEATALCRSMQMENIDIELIRDIFQEGDIKNYGQLTVGEFFHRLNKKLITSITEKKGCISLPKLETKAGWEDCNLIERELVIEMWEKAGISHCRQMLHDLGFSGKIVNISELAMCLDDEIKSLLGDVNKVSGINVPSLLLQASLCLHRHELRCIRDAMDQVFAENAKMKTDLNAANQRAQMLAQEVDENHAKMENSLKIKIKQLETKTLEINHIAEEERTKEREMMHLEMSQLRDKLSSLEIEESKLRSHCASLKHTNEELERKLSHSEELTRELEQVRVHLTREIKSLKTENEKLSNPSGEQASEIEKLAALVSDFRLENKSLRDQNDELLIEIEDLQHKLTRENRRLSLGRSKPQFSVDITSEQAISLLEECEGGLDSRRDGPNATKRRGDSPSNGQYALFDEESPRIGKLRRYQGDTDNEKQYTADLSDEGDLKSTRDSSSLHIHQSMQVEDKEMCKIHQQPFLILNSDVLNLIKQTLNSNNEKSKCESCNTLTGILSTIHEQIGNVNVGETDEKTNIKATNETIIAQNELKIAVEKNKELENEMKQLKGEKEKLSNVCRDLELSLEQLKSEYDKCEEYWANKLDEEREVFTEEQRISDEKFQDLLSKISEYEEQFAPTQKNQSKLPTIDEKYSLETQFTDLEEEYELYKEKKSLELELKVQEISQLREKIKELENTNNLDLKSNSYKITESNIDEIDSGSKATAPIHYLLNQSTIQQPMQKNSDRKRDNTRDYQNPAYNKCSSQEDDNTDKAKVNSDVEKDPSIINSNKKSLDPDKISSSDIHKNRFEKSENRSVRAWSERGSADSQQVLGGMIQCSELEGHLRKNAHPSQKERGWGENEVHLLEQRCRQLHLALTQHQLYLQTVQQNARSENNILRQRLQTAEVAIGNLQQRLTSADILVKELYVENCQLSVFKPHPL